MKIRHYIIFFIFFITNLLYSTIIYIPSDQPTIQDGIDTAVDGDSVLIQPGIYYENINFLGKNITVASFFLTTQDTSYISETIIDGNQNGSVVTFENEEDSTAALIGLTITNGSGKEFIVELGGFNNLVYHGGGIYCKYAYPKIDNLIIENNVSNRGGGIFIENDSGLENNRLVTINDCKIKNNEAERGLVYMSLYPGLGGGIFNFFSNLGLNNLQIENNYGENGGGIWSFASEIKSNEIHFFGNTADAGSNLYLCSSDMTINKSLMVENLNTGFSNGTLCLYRTTLNLNNCTICNNESSYGFICLRKDSHLNVSNSIFWNNDPQIIYCYSTNEPSTITISYSDVENGERIIETNDNCEVYWLEGNIDTDPLFDNNHEEEYYLQAISPCIDAGDPNSPLDPDGTIADMGAFYFDQNNETEEFFVINEYENLMNYPNPFRTTTKISYELPTNIENATIGIFSIKGQTIREYPIFNNQSSIFWDGRDEYHNQVSSGVYFYRLISDERVLKTKKMILIK